MYKLLLCLRYLRSRYIAMASIVSVMLGVATMIVVNSVMAGFSTEMRDRLHGLLADVLLESNSYDGITNPKEQLDLVHDVAGDYIEATAATVEVYGILNYQFAGQWITQPITLIGIDPIEKSQVGPLIDYLDSYHVVKQAGKVVRPALRSRDVAPSWELTDDAVRYRTQRKRQSEQQRWYTQEIGQDWRPFDDPSTETSSKKNHGVTGKLNAGGAENGGLPATGTEIAASADVGPWDAGPSTVEPEDDSSRLASDPFSSVKEPEEPVDQTKPLKARLYVGIGLVSWPDQDPKTGETKTMMMVRPGDDLKITTSTASTPPRPADFDATVVDVFKSGMSEYDSNLVFCNIEALQEIRGMIDPTSKEGSITSIQIKLKNFGDADEVVQRLRSVFPPGLFTVRTWEQKQGPLLAAVEIESAILNVLLFLIITVAGFGILAIFFMIVVEKTRDIGILKALGASSRGVMSIFLSYGLALGIVGSGVGVVMGLVFVRYINVIESWLTWLTGRKVFDETIYYFPKIPTNVQPAMVIWVAIGAMAIAVLASILPARRAARLHPVEALRYE